MKIPINSGYFASIQVNSAYRAILRKSMNKVWGIPTANQHSPSFKL